MKQRYEKEIVKMLNQIDDTVFLMRIHMIVKRHLSILRDKEVQENG